MDEDTTKVGRRWLALILLGVLLHAGAFFNSDLGLDAHVRLNAISDEVHEGQALGWGKLRIPAESVQSPNASVIYDGYIPPWSTSETAMKLTSLVALMAVAGLAAIVPKWQRNRGHVEMLWPVLILMSPVFLFAVGRGYDEPMVALLIGMGTGGYYLNKGDEPHEIRVHLLLLATSLLLVMGWKGFAMISAFGVWLLVIGLGSTWIELERRQRSKTGETWLSHPWFMGGALSLSVYLSMFVAGFLAESGTFAIVGEQPVKYALASLFALVDALGIFLLLGFAFWPFISSSFVHLQGLRGPGITLLVMFISGLLTAIIGYIAALWTLESTLWGLSLTETMVLLGNNGRYATCLVIPLVMMINWERSSPAVQSASKTSLVVACCLLLPAVVFTSFVGQQLWSEDAGEGLHEVMIDGDSSILLVAPDALAMHHLYVLKTHVDLDGTSEIDGFWRTSQEAAIFIDDATVKPDLVVIAPNTKLSLDGQQWELIVEGKSPVTVTGWTDDGSWRIYRYVV